MICQAIVIDKGGKYPAIGIQRLIKNPRKSACSAGVRIARRFRRYAQKKCSGLYLKYKRKSAKPVRGRIAYGASY